MTTTTTDVPQTVTAWYENCTEQYQDLYDMICDTIPWADKWDVEDVIEFIEELRDLGLENASQFEDAYSGSYDGFKPYKEFSEELAIEIGMVDVDSPIFSFIDFEEVWERLFRFDYSTIEFNHDVYFFHNI